MGNDFGDDHPLAADVCHDGVERGGGGQQRRGRDGGSAVDDLPEVLLLEDMVVLLRCSKSTIKRRLRAGVFPLSPLPGIDRKLRWSKAAVLRWLATGETSRGHLGGQPELKRGRPRDAQDGFGRRRRRRQGSDGGSG